MSGLLEGTPFGSDPRDRDEVARLRVPPHSIEAEQSVIGGLLLDNSAWDRCGDLLSDSDFYRHEHRSIYAAIGALVAASKPADVITVYEELQKLGKDEDCGGLPYLNSLAQSLPSAANMRRYAEIVRERSILRSLIAASDQMATSAFNPGKESVSSILGKVQDIVFRLGDMGASASGDTFKSMDTLIVKLLDNVQDMFDRGGDDVIGIPTGFIDLDKVLAGLLPGLLYLVGGRPSMGKTSFALNIAEHVALKEKLPVVVFSMEMGAEELAQRLLGSVGRIFVQSIRNGRLKDGDWGRLSDAVEQLRNVLLDIDDSPALSMAELSARSRRKARQYGKLGAVVIDYVQLMSGPEGSDENRATMLGEISRGLKRLAKELQCPVIALTQLNRGVEQRSDKRPMMSDLRESGALEQDADVIMFIYRDDYYNKHSREPGVAEVIIAKNRQGDTRTVKLAFLKPLTKFDNLAPDWEPQPPTKSGQAEY